MSNSDNEIQDDDLFKHFAKVDTQTAVDQESSRVAGEACEKPTFENSSKNTKVFLNVNEVALRYGISRATVWRWVKNNELPAPLKLSARITRWNVDGLILHEQSIARGVHS